MLLLARTGLTTLAVAGRGLNEWLGRTEVQLLAPKRRALLWIGTCHMERAPPTNGQLKMSSL